MSTQKRTGLRITPIDDSKVNLGTVAKYRGVDLIIARASNDSFVKKFTKLLAPIKSDYENDAADPDQLEEILCRSLAGTVLTGWENFKIGEEVIEYNEENATSLLKDDPDCRIFVQKFAQNINNFLNDQSAKTKAK